MLAAGSLACVHEDRSRTCTSLLSLPARAALAQHLLLALMPAGRFKSDNILLLELDMPERTTFDYNAPGMDRVQIQVGWAPSELHLV